ncbi:hypothetical protein Cfor_05356 [Coptotermes formosanus]|uniref:Uncharacterized protein n=1 Tax=Coptotermes formosanus TaxID=36987 RepID=A0A6L2QF07_COPFO|nr:hypothetical protein Cfor_05356 [Coptotermes formosanus]
MQLKQPSLFFCTENPEIKTLRATLRSIKNKALYKETLLECRIIGPYVYRFVEINVYLKCYCYDHKVTGAAQGIGRQLALEFWEHGSTVLCVDIDEEGNHVTARTINAMHRHRLEGTGATVRAGWERAHAYTCDVTDRHQVAETAQRVLKDFGRVDILVNNAPNTAAPKVHAPEVVVDVVNGNLLSHFWVSCKFVESYLLGVRKFGMSLRR